MPENSGCLWNLLSLCALAGWVAAIAYFKGGFETERVQVQPRPLFSPAGAAGSPGPTGAVAKAPSLPVVPVQGSTSQQRPTKAADVRTTGPPPPDKGLAGSVFSDFAKPSFTLLLPSLADEKGEAKQILEKVLPSGHRANYGGDSGFPENKRETDFIVLVLRNPCDWYSRWAMVHAGKAFNYRQPTFGPNPFLPEKMRAMNWSNPQFRQSNAPNNLDANQFKDWFTNLRFPDGKGFLSFYVWMLVIAPECFLAHIKHSKLEDSAPWEKCGNTTRMWEDWQKFSLQTTAHCWVFHETILDDFRVCLQAYEKSSKYAKGAVNWKSFDELVANDPDSGRLKVGKSCMKYWGPGASVSENDVKAADPFLFEKLGYSRCCSDSSGAGKWASASWSLNTSPQASSGSEAASAAAAVPSPSSLPPTTSSPVVTSADVSAEVGSSLPWTNTVPNLSFSSKVKPRFFLQHLTKAGGTYAHWLMEKVLASDHRDYSSDDQAYPIVTPAGAFTVLIVRNPCDWYVSWANFNAGKAFNYRQETFGPNPFLPKSMRGMNWSNPKYFQADSPHPMTAQHFRDFFINVRFKDGKGFLSYYVWMLFVAPECFLAHLKHSYHPEETKKWQRCGSTERMWEDWKSFSFRERARCYVFHETFTDDFRICLQAYERSSPYAKGSVNWTLFNDIVAGRGDVKFTNRDKVLSKQGSRHKPCSFFFGEGGVSESEVKASDPFLFEPLGYTSCCTPSSRKIW